MTDQDPTVLVVDDDHQLADLYAAWLETEYDVRTAYGGPSAFEAIDSDVDVALVDRLMPQVSGDELLEQIRAEGYDCRVSIVTAVDPDFDIIEMGFDEYVVKPVRREDIETVVDSLVTRSEVRTEGSGVLFARFETGRSRSEKGSVRTRFEQRVYRTDGGVRTASIGDRTNRGGTDGS